VFIYLYIQQVFKSFFFDIDTTALEFHPHFPFLATADNNGCVHIYTNQTNEEI